MIYQDRELHEECGVFGVVGHQDAAQIYNIGGKKLLVFVVKVMVK